MHLYIAAACAALFALPAAAQEVNTAATPACVEAARTAGTAPNECLAEALRPCHQFSEETPALVTLCFDNARSGWAEATAKRLTEIDAQAPEQIAGRARVETKYDLLSGLLQCDRMEELARLSEIDAEPLLLEKTRCEATATGFAYIRLLWRVTPD